MHDGSISLEVQAPLNFLSYVRGSSALVRSAELTQCC